MKRILAVMALLATGTSLAALQNDGSPRNVRASVLQLTSDSARVGCRYSAPLAVTYQVTFRAGAFLRTHSTPAKADSVTIPRDTIPTAGTCVVQATNADGVSPLSVPASFTIPAKAKPLHPPGQPVIEGVTVDTMIAPPDTTVPPDTLPQPPPAGLWPNEPVGQTLAVDEPFTLRLLSPQPAGPWEFGNGFTTTNLITVQPVTGGGSALRWTYPQGYGGGDSPGRAVVTRTTMQFHTLYIGVTVRWSVPWEPNSSGANKILYWGNMEAREALGHGPSQYYLNRRGNIVDITLQYAQTNGQSNVPSGSMPRLRSTNVGDGAWHRVEMLATGNDAGASNCRLQVWVDGALEFDVGTLRCSNDATRFYGINLDPIWGGTGGVKPQTDWMELDHVRMSGRT